MAYVYVISAGELHQKIGLTENLNSRVSALQTAHYLDLTLVFAADVPNPEDVERRAHKFLADRRLKREWFLVTVAEAIDAVKRAIRFEEMCQHQSASVGDRVECIDTDWFDDSEEEIRPVVGAIYTVEACYAPNRVKLVEFPNSDWDSRGFGVARRLDHRVIAAYLREPLTPRVLPAVIDLTGR